MITFEKGNLLLDNYANFVIFHQCNCVTKESKGLCKSIFEAFPESNDYIKPTKRIPGTTMFHKCNNRIIANAYAQRYPGCSKYDNDSTKLRILWFENCLTQLKEFCEREKIFKVAIPEFIGCGLAGGDWEIYLEMIRRFSQMNDSLEIHVVSFKP